MAEQPVLLYGTEMEWPVDAEWVDGAVVPGVPLVGRTSYSDLPENITRCGTFLSNGMRLYNDHNFFEISGPEVDDLDELVASEMIGEELLQLILESALADGRVEWYKIQRRVIDSKQNTWGYHENYLALRQLIGQMNIHQLGLLATHLALRNLFVGAGAFVDGEYRIAQKASRVFTDIDESTTINDRKPVINARDKPYANGKYRRLHITSCDPNISPWATRVKVGSTALIVRMVQHGERAQRLQLAPGGAHALARQVATDLSFEEPFQLATAETMRPIDMMDVLITRMETFLTQHEVSNGEVWVARQMRRAYEAFTTNPKELQKYMDWPLRKVTIERQLAKAGMSADIDLADTEQLRDPKIASTIKKVAEEADLSYDFVASDSRKNSLTKVYQKRLWQSYMPSEELLAKRLDTPPDGRPKCRGDHIKTGELSNASWDAVRYYQHGKVREVALDNPLAA
jgi:hypothetical protein